MFTLFPVLFYFFIERKNLYSLKKIAPEEESIEPKKGKTRSSAFDAPFFENGVVDVNPVAEHIKAWNNEYKSSIWNGHYSLDLLDPGFKKGRLLDAGCGSGKYSLPLKMRGFDVVGVDVSSRALKMADERAGAHKLDIDLLAANICRMPFPDSSFDLIWCFGVLQHLLSEERELTIHEFLRVLKKGGLLFIEVFGKDDMRYGGKQVEPDTFSRRTGVIYHYFDKNELNELLNGFSSIINETRKEKRFEGKAFTRHVISAVAKK